MKLYGYILISLFFVSGNSVFAQNQNLNNNDRLKKLCNLTQNIEHVPTSDVEYQPGIDAKGNFIVPPDIGLASNENIFPMQIPIELDIIERFNLGVPVGIISDPQIAGIIVSENGEVSYNGQKVTQNIEKFCFDNEIIKVDHLSEKQAPEKMNDKINIDIESLPPIDGSF